MVQLEAVAGLAVLTKVGLQNPASRYELSLMQIALVASESRLLHLGDDIAVADDDTLNRD